MKNHIEEYFTKNESQPGTELFRIDDSNVDIKTELTEQEIRDVNTLMMNDKFLEKVKVGAIFKNYYQHLLRLKISLNRKGRSEYVDINKHDNSDEVLTKFGNLSNISNRGLK